MDSLISQIEQRKQRWLDFYAGEPVARHLYWVHFFPDLGDRPWPFPDLISERIDWSWRKYQIQCEQTQWLADDSLPFLDIYTGTEIFAEAFGCRVHRPSGDMPFALPLVHSAEEAARLPVPDLDAPPLATAFHIAQELRARAGSGALVRLPDIQSPMDIAALIWDKSSFYPAMVNEPEAVLALAEKVSRVVVAFLEEWFRQFGQEFIAHYPDYYMPYGITLSEDEVGAVSPAMFQRFFLPELTELSRHFGSMGMHCCANSMHQWKHFKEIPNLRMLNIIQPDDVVREAYPFFKDVCGQTHGFQGSGPVWSWAGQWPEDCRILFDVNVSSRAEAEAVIEGVKAV